MQTYDVIIIGAGAAGLMCAQTAAQRGRRVLVLDHANKAGKKILMSGGGRCNFTNMYCSPEDFISRNTHFVKSALARYTPWHFMELIHKHAVAYEEKQAGQLFCSNSAKDVLAMLLAECEQAGVTLQLKTRIDSVQYQDSDGFKLKTNAHTYQCQSLVIATGGLSIPTMGATGFGYQVAQQFGHSLVPTRAGLVPFTITDEKLKQLCTALAGSSINNCRLTCNGHEFVEDLLFTHRGLSGPVVLQASLYWQTGQPISLDLLNRPDAAQWLLEQQQQRPNIELKTLLGERFTKKIAQLLTEFFNFNNQSLRNYSASQLEHIAQQLSHWSLTPAGTEGYRTAEVTLGGINTNEVSSKTMASKYQTDLYFIGEVLDVTGHLGGFNFQWAWASGHAAGSCV
ncbi:NAD(P)/FAD-dependent oxidoreductase [Thiopseudomonas acetoxidans]|uniref:NAD(P)/FAD-dependent oxidoreductase n=1 Tax=Thiopseudomonas acetoxidans TaxID=3041622 RepID=A0ABT7SQI1_9GAMM|nr:NAD(P)/FAD-dependent oxidoreductase [Thiopseudomonas sp. CY1220]MDM7858435.1 NAD(P)/FAD-dependent oxidoreductase [Thiopseudomonas sp. CY1220]